MNRLFSKPSDYQNTKMTAFRTLTLIPKLRKLAKQQKKAPLPSSISEPDIDFRKLVDKLL